MTFLAGVPTHFTVFLANQLQPFDLVGKEGLEPSSHKDAGV